jgi:hypothetical protein
MTATDLTLGQAARLCDRGKTTLARAIKSGRMSASRRDDGGYLINVAELERVFGPLNGATVAATGDVVHHATPPVTDAATNALVAELRGMLADVRADRDRWRDMAERLSLPKPAEPAVQRPWWRRLAG